MKKGKLLIALVAVLVVCTGALVAVNVSNEAKAKALQEEQMAAEPTNTYDSIVSLSKEEITELSVTDHAGTITYLPTEDNWSIKDAPSVAFDNSAINATCNRLLQVSSARIFEDPDLNEFGLADSTQQIEYKLADGQTIQLTLGTYTPDGNNLYAIKDGDTSKAYLISAYTGKEVISSFDRFRITTLGAFDSTLFKGIEASGRDIENFVIEPSTTATNFVSFTLNSPGTKPLNLDAQALENLLGSVPTFTVDTFIEDGVTDLSPYGLDDPVLHLTLKTKNPEDETKTDSVEYLWGNDLEDGSIYFMQAGTDSVYTMKGDSVHAFLKQLTTFNLSDKLVALTNIQAIDSVDATFGNSTYTFSIKREEVPAEVDENASTVETEETSTEPEMEVVESYFINDLELEESDFKAIYQGIIGVKGDIDLTTKEVDFNAEPIATFVFHHTDGTSKQYDFYAYDNQFHAYKVDDKLVMGCNIKQFTYTHNLLTEYTGY